MNDRRFDFAVLGLGVCAVSTAALFIREADAPALVIAAYRLTIASAPLLALRMVRREPPTARDSRATLLMLLAGVFLALHFAFWIASVKQTSVVTSVVLVTAQPLFVAIASGPLLGERPAASTWLGIVLAASGAVVMIADDFGAGAETLQGDLFAILGAIFASAYFLTGRNLRTSGQSWLSYVTLVYTTAAVVLVAIAIVSGDAFTGHSTSTYAFMVALALVPQLIGHTALNRSLGYLPAVSVTVAVLGEPVGATILGILFLDETPSVVQALGGLLVLLGVYVGLRGSMRSPRQAARLQAEGEI